MKSLLILTLVISSSCSMFERRDFAREMGYGEMMVEEPTFMAHRDFMVVAGDNGRDYRSNREIYGRTPATARTKEDRIHQSSLMKELMVLENRATEEEYSDYLKYSRHLETLSEKIYYLRLPMRERRAYMRARGVGAKRTIAGYQVYTPQNGLFMGMGKQEVTQKMGEPIAIDVAGNPTEENERWAFRQNGKIRYIFFEKGKVQGWSDQR